MNPKSKAGMLAAMAFAMAAGAMGERQQYVSPKETLERKKKRLEKAQENINLARGLKPFEVNGQTIWAISEKVAWKKARKLLNK